MLIDIITNINNKPLEGDFFYELEFPRKIIKLNTKRLITSEEQHLLKMLLLLKSIKKIDKILFKDPVTKATVTLEQEDYLWFVSKLSGIKNIKENKEASFIYTKLSSNYFNILNFNEQLNSDHKKYLVLYMLSNNLFSYEMLYTLFSMLEKKIPISSLISGRAYESFLSEITPLKEQLENNKPWEILTLFISNYHYLTFLREKKVFPEYELLLENIRAAILKNYFEKIPFIQIILKLIPKKEMVNFISTLADGELGKSINEKEWSNLRAFVSKRTFNRIKEDIYDFYKQDEIYEARIKILSKIIQFLIKIKPPYFFLNKIPDMNQVINLIFDKVGPLYTFIFLKEEPQFSKEVLNSLTPFRSAFIKQMLTGKMKKRGGITRSDIQISRTKIHFFIAAQTVFPEIWFILEM